MEESRKKRGVRELIQYGTPNDLKNGDRGAKGVEEKQSIPKKSRLAVSSGYLVAEVL